MKKLLLFTLALVILISCSTSRQIERAVSVGNFDRAITDALGKLRNNKNKRRKAEYIVMLKEAYVKANERDKNEISFLKKDGNPENLIKIYDLYSDLDERQQRIAPVLPLYVNDKKVKFTMKDYASDIISSKDKASLYLYKNAKAQLTLNSNTKTDYRFIFDQLQEIEDMNPNYQDVRQLMNEAQARGTDFVLVEMRNESQKVIPVRLEQDLLNFSTYGINNFWTVYHNTLSDDTTYDYSMRVNIREINTSPEQVRERQIIKEKQITDGKKLLLDEFGNQVKDSLGNAIEIDHLKTVRCEFYEFQQFKTVQVTGSVEYHNLNTQQLADAFPVSSQFIFEHIYADARGDRRALDTNLLPFLDQVAIPFPTEEQMIYSSGEALKLQLKQIMNSYVLN